MGHGNASDSKVSISEDKIKKILTTAKIQVPSESPKYAGSETSGTFHTSIVGRFENERARLGPNFTEKDRQWRIKFLKAQDLHPSEPFDVPELRKVHYNPIRRFYRYPLNLLEDFLTPKLVRYLLIIYGFESNQYFLFDFSGSISCNSCQKDDRKWLDFVLFRLVRMVSAQLQPNELGI
ncbi:hypothetical protein SSS_06607 [Sarcoptes scabiei]|uniref:Uncharacterized protein n=1 Tax=Sarcoptes scabiei TaxID=52283 RepID=A0A834RF26_SARSC|nr:hypothetical protein SSS_06607 [Sarcoptes scabiei]